MKPGPVKTLLFGLCFFVASAAGSQATTTVSWSFEPAEHLMSPGQEILLTAVLVNEPASSESLVASDVLTGSGVNWVPGQNLFQEGLDLEFVFGDFSEVVLAPGEALEFLWGTVTNWKDVEPGDYTVDYASINGHNSPTAIVASNVFTITFVPEPSSALLLCSGLAFVSLLSQGRRPGKRPT